MLKKYFAKKAAKKGVKWIAKREAQVALTAIATLATQKVLQEIGKKYPSLSFLKNRKVV
jgi:hypothetical protein